MALHPLLLERHLDDRIWGGNRLASFLGLSPPYPERIAESWQVYDANRVINGPLAGQTLAQVAARYGDKLLGTLSPPRYGADLSLLVKFIDAQQDLSIQVHPDDDYAHQFEAQSGFHGKSEFSLVVQNPHGLRFKQNARVAQLVFIRLNDKVEQAYSGMHKGLE